jgi:hypothetical protein
MSNEAILAGLNPVCADIAQQFLDQFPTAILTSGRRNIEDQARAMAANSALNSQWIVQTYMMSQVSQACQLVVSQRLKITGQPATTADIVAVLNEFSPYYLRQLSWHLSGDAFDVQPTADVQMPIVLQALVSARITAGGFGKFLVKEGGLTRWHVQVY